MSQICEKSKCKFHKEWSIGIKSPITNGKIRNKHHASEAIKPLPVSLSHDVGLFLMTILPQWKQRTKSENSALV